LADVIREMGFRKGTEFYIALGQGKISTKTVVNKILQRLKTGEAVDADDLRPATEHSDRARRTKDASNYGIVVKGVEDVAVRLAKCCPPAPRDGSAGYVTLGLW